MGGVANCGFDDDSAQFRSAARTMVVDFWCTIMHIHPTMRSFWVKGLLRRARGRKKAGDVRRPIAAGIATPATTTPDRTIRGGPPSFTVESVEKAPAADAKRIHGILGVQQRERGPHLVEPTPPTSSRPQGPDAMVAPRGRMWRTNGRFSRTGVGAQGIREREQNYGGNGSPLLSPC